MRPPPLGRLLRRSWGKRAAALAPAGALTRHPASRFATALACARTGENSNNTGIIGGAVLLVAAGAAALASQNNAGAGMTSTPAPAVDAPQPIASSDDDA